MASRYGTRFLLDTPTPSVSQYVCRSCRSSTNNPRTFCTSTNTTRSSRRARLNVPDHKTAGFDTSQIRFLATERTQARAQTVYADDEIVQSGSHHSRSVAQKGNLESEQSKATKPQNSSETDLQPLQEQYTPAKTWDNLQFIGHREGDWKNLPPTRKMRYEPWMKKAQDVAFTQADLTHHLARALISAHLSTGLSDGQKLNEQRLSALRSFVGEEDQVAIEVETTQNGSVESVTATTPESQTKLTEYLNSIFTHTTSDVATSSTQEASFLHTKMNMVAPATFETIKYLSKFLAISVPDPILTKVSTSPEPTWSQFLALLLRHLTPRPSSQKLAERLVHNTTLLSQPNVAVYNRRITPVDKEIEVGRWKVIVEELERRGLPVLGKPKIVR